MVELLSAKVKKNRLSLIGDSKVFLPANFLLQNRNAPCWYKTQNLRIPLSTRILWSTSNVLPGRKLYMV